MGGRGVGSVALCLLIAAGVAAAPASAGTYSNSATITTPSSGAGVGTPYPSTITVSGEAGTLVKARVTLNDILAASRDLDVLLKGPGGSTMLYSDICQGGSTVPDLIHLTYTFDDDASAPLPSDCTGAPPSGSYRPSNYDTLDNFPGNPGPYPVGLSNFRGVSPNGAWQLFVYDDGPADGASIGGWSLDLTTTGAPPAQAAKKKCRKHKRRSARAAKKRCKKKR
jgi:hypothetical protein